MVTGRSTPRLPHDVVERRLFVDAAPAAVWRPADHDPGQASASDPIPEHRIAAANPHRPS